MSTPTTSTLNGDAATGQPVQTLIQTSDDKAVSKLGQPISPAAPSSDSINGGMGVSSVVPVSVKPVDRKTITGSYSGDSRADYSSASDAAISKIANPPNPRERVGQFPLGKNTPDAASAPITTANVEQVGD